MITIFALSDKRGVLINPFTYKLRIVQEKVSQHLARNVLLASDDAFSTLLNGLLPAQYELILISEKLFKEYSTQGDHGYIHHGGNRIVTNFQHALSLAREGRRMVTLLGGPPLFEEAVRIRSAVDRLILLRIPSQVDGAFMFPFAIRDFFDRVLIEQYVAKKEEQMLFEVWWRK